MASSLSSPSPSSSSSSSDLSTQILQLTFGDQDLVRRIKSSNILLVGAGGIGCEVIKGLLLTGFERITLIDLDTIDVSNLNRQFLYNKSHVGKSKAEVAAAVSVERFSHRDPATGRPISQVTPIHGSILDISYNKEFYRGFTFVINALDNNTTRVHVNRMCLAADVPLIESASASYNGNVKLIKRGVTQCFECEPPKKDENTYASCTIRNTPSLPIHCIVWAKHLFAQLFGQPDEEDVSPDVSDPNLLSTDSNNGENGNATNGDISNERISNSQSTRQYVESTGYDPKALFEKIFNKDIIYLKMMENLWKKRKAPQELNYDQVAAGEIKFEDVNSNATSDSNVNENNNNQNSSSELTNSVIRDQKIWSISECLEVFRSSLSKLKERLRTEQTLEWDKDDDVAVDFVASVSNFRSYIFSIPRKSKFDVKSLAGNIIPAIPTTNTIVGGFIILQTIRLLSNLLPERFSKDEASELTPEQVESETAALKANGFSVYITNQNRKNLSKLYVEPLLPPKSDCLACSTDIKEIIVGLPLEKTSLGDFVEQVIKKKFKTIAPDVNVFGLNKMIWAAEDEEDLSDAIRNKLLSSYDFMRDNVCLIVKDLEQNFEVHLVLRDMEFNPEENEGEFYKVLNQQELDAAKEQQLQTDESQNGDVAETVSTEANVADKLIDIDDDEPVLLQEEEDEPISKRARIVPNDDDFEMIEMSELDEADCESIKLANSAALKPKRAIDGDEDEIELIDDDELGAATNGNSHNNSTKRIRTQ